MLLQALEICHQILRRLKTMLGILFQATVHDGVQAGGEIGATLLQRSRLTVQDFVPDTSRCASLEGLDSGRHLVNDNTQ